MFHRHLKLSMTPEGSSPLHPPWSPFSLWLPCFCSHITTLLVTQTRNPGLTCNSSLFLISYGSSVTKSCQSHLLNSFLPLPPGLYDPGLHLPRPVAQSICDQAVDIAGCLPHSYSPSFPPYQQTPLTMIETESPDASSSSLLCSQAWPCDLVLANKISEEVFWEASGMIFFPLLICPLLLMTLLAVLFFNF